MDVRLSLRSRHDSGDSRLTQAKQIACSRFTLRFASCAALFSSSRAQVFLEIPLLTQWDLRNTMRAREDSNLAVTKLTVRLASRGSSSLSAAGHASPSFTPSKPWLRRLSPHASKADCLLQIHTPLRFVCAREDSNPQRLVRSQL